MKDDLIVAEPVKFEFLEAWNDFIYVVMDIKNAASQNEDGVGLVNRSRAGFTGFINVNNIFVGHFPMKQHTSDI
jgi:hypothetical protein